MKKLLIVLFIAIINVSCYNDSSQFHSETLPNSVNIATKSKIDTIIRDGNYDYVVINWQYKASYANEEADMFCTILSVFIICSILELKF